MPEIHTFEDYCGAVCREIRFSPDHDAIAAELTTHLQERTDALLAANPDMCLRDAEQLAIAAMGDPVALGHALDAVHNPRLGWFQIWFRRAVKLIAVLVLLVALSRVYALSALFPDTSSHSLRQRFQDQEISVNYLPDLTVSARNYNITVEEALMLEAEPTPVFVILLRIPHDPWAQDVEFANWLSARDDLGGIYLSLEEYIPQYIASPASVIPHCASGGIDHTPFVSWYTVMVQYLNPDARELTFIFDRFGEEFSFSLPLRGGA